MSSPPVALITGGARRIGAALCKHLHERGFNIAIHYNQSSKPAALLADELNNIRPDSARIFQADLNSNCQIQNLAEQVIDQWGQLNALVNNASSFYPTPIVECSEDQWHDLINTNLKAPLFLAQSLHNALTKTGGCIVNIADIFAERPMPNHTIYSIAKAGNKMLTQSLALEFAPSVRVNSVAPGAILWPENKEGKEIVNTEKIKRIPLGRLGGTDAIAQAVYFFIQHSPYTTGQVLKVDGGRSLT